MINDYEKELYDTKWYLIIIRNIWYIIVPHILIYIHTTIIYILPHIKIKAFIVFVDSWYLMCLTKPEFLRLLILGGES